MFTYRPATIDDIPFLAAIRLEVTENALTDPGRVPRAQYHDYLTTGGKGWVCEVDRTVVGFSIACAAEKTVWALFVHPEYEGKGIGSNLLTLAVNWLFDSGVDSVSLRTVPDTRMADMCRTKGWMPGERSQDNHIHYTLTRQTS